MINRVILVGRITKDPELRYTSTSNVPFVQFTLAVNRTYSKDGQREADFINCVVWRQQAENLARYIKKGALLGIEGSIQVRSYDDANGQRRTATDVICDSIQFLEPKGTGGFRQDNSNPFDDIARQEYKRPENKPYQQNQYAQRQSDSNAAPQGMGARSSKPDNSFDDIFNTKKEDKQKDKDVFDDLSGDYDISNDDLPF